MKTFSKCLAIVLAVAGAATLAGCNNGSPNYKTATTANWNVRTSASVEENSFEFWQTQKEVATYKVEFTEGSNDSYKVSYNCSSATYTTEFYMLAAYDWKSDKIIEEYRSTEEGSDTEPVYVYTTSFTISGEYQLKPNGDRKQFSDELITTSYFRPAGKNLQPVYSYQKVKNTAPATLSTGSIDAAYVEIDEEYETFYNKQCSQATVIKTVADKDEKETKKIGLSSEYSNFDNSQLRAAVRAFTLSGGASRTFNVVTPQNGNLQGVTASVSSPVELDTQSEDANMKVIYQGITSALDNAPDNYIFFDGTVDGKQEGEKDRNYRYSAVTLSINESLRGTSPTMWYSTVENNDVNGTRCVLLRMSTPLSFGLGTLNYTLKTLTLETVQ